MPEFVFQAKNARGKVVRGKIRAETADHAKKQLTEQRYQVVSLKEKRGLFAKIDWFLASLKPINLAELAFTTRQLSVMVAAGIPMTRSLGVLNQLPMGSGMAKAWQDVTVHLNQGDQLSRALGRHPDIFSMLYIGMVKAGESSGQIVENLTYVADHLEKELILRGKIRAAMTYPALVFVLCICMAVLIVQHILPQFIDGLFKGSGVALPWPTQILVAVTTFFNDPYMLAGAGVTSFLVGVMLNRYLRTPAGKYRSQKILLSIPYVRLIVAKVLAARFCRTMGTLVGCGIPIIHSLELTNLVMGSYVLAEYVGSMKNRVKEGGKLSEGLREIPFFPPVIASFVQLGEETGRIPELLGRLSKVFEEDLEVALEAFTALIEPVMVGVMGSFVGFVLIAIFIPLYKILGTF